MPRYIHKPRPFAAVRWDGTNTTEVERFCCVPASKHEGGGLAVAALVLALDDYICKSSIDGSLYVCPLTVFNEFYQPE